MKARRFFPLLLTTASLSVLLTSCPNGFGWREASGKNLATSNKTKPTQGAKMDINANYKNDCGQELEAYFIEMPPNSSFDCSEMTDVGSVAPDGAIQVTLHQGKIGYVVFATSSDGKCSSAAQKATAWIDGSGATASDAHFNICSQ